MLNSNMDTKIVFRFCKVQATELQEDLTLKEFVVSFNQGSVIGIQHIQQVSPNIANIIVTETLTYWNVSTDLFEIIGDQQQMQAARCCG